MSSAPIAAIGSHRNPATLVPSASTTRPIVSGAGTPSTKVPNPAASSDQTSTSTVPAPSSVAATRTSPGFGGSVASAYMRYTGAVVVRCTSVAARDVSWWLSG